MHVINTVSFGFLQNHHYVQPTYQQCSGIATTVVISISAAEWRARRPLHHDHFLIYCAFPIVSILPVVPYLHKVQYLA
jgi:hypothetical protein